jgi:hypothetical protein
MIQAGISFEMIAEAQDVFARYFALAIGFLHAWECLQQLNYPFLNDPRLRKSMKVSHLSRTL